MLGCTCTSIRMRRYKFTLNLPYFCIFSRYYSNLVINNKILLLLIENSYQKNVIATPVRECTNYTAKPFSRMANPLIQTSTSFQLQQQFSVNLLLSLGQTILVIIFSLHCLLLVLYLQLHASFRRIQDDPRLCVMEAGNSSFAVDLKVFLAFTLGLGMFGAYFFLSESRLTKYVTVTWSLPYKLIN